MRSDVRCLRRCDIILFSITGFLQARHLGSPFSFEVGRKYIGGVLRIELLLEPSLPKSSVYGINVEKLLCCGLLDVDQKSCYGSSMRREPLPASLIWWLIWTIGTGSVLQDVCGCPDTAWGVPRHRPAVMCRAPWPKEPSVPPTPTDRAWTLEAIAFVALTRSPYYWTVAMQVAEFNRLHLFPLTPLVKRRDDAPFIAVPALL